MRSNQNSAFPPHSPMTRFFVHPIRRRSSMPVSWFERVHRSDCVWTVILLLQYHLDLSNTAIPCILGHTNLHEAGWISQIWRIWTLASNRGISVCGTMSLAMRSFALDRRRFFSSSLMTAKRRRAGRVVRYATAQGIHLVRTL